MIPGTLRENIIDLHWDHAVELGVPGHRTHEPWSYSTDPEALTILVAILSDARLKREWTGWINMFGDWFYKSRLKRLLDDLHRSLDREYVEKYLPTVKSFLLTIEKETDHSFERIIEQLDPLDVNRENPTPGEQPKIARIKSKKIVRTQPRLFWRHIAGVNARAELLANVEEGWTGNSNRGSSELYLPQTSLQRAIHNLEPTGMIAVGASGNSKIVSRGPDYSVPYNYPAKTFMDWGNWIKAIIKTTDLIDKNIDKELSDSLEERFTQSIRSIFEDEIQKPDFVHRHGNDSSQKLIKTTLEREH